MGTVLRRTSIRYNISIEHRPGKSMVHVDALSRNPVLNCLLVGECEKGLLARLRKAQREDSNLKKIFDAIERGESSDCVIRDGILYKNEDDVRVIVPRVMRWQIIRKAYEQGHFGTAKTEALLERLLDSWFTGRDHKSHKELCCLYPGRAKTGKDRMS